MTMLRCDWLSDEQIDRYRPVEVTVLFSVFFQYIPSFQYFSLMRGSKSGVLLVLLPVYVVLGILNS